jgi:hypothetical protein
MDNMKIFQSDSDISSTKIKLEYDFCMLNAGLTNINQKKVYYTGNKFGSNISSTM